MGRGRRTAGSARICPIGWAARSHSVRLHPPWLLKHHDLARLSRLSLLRTSVLVVEPIERVQELAEQAGPLIGCHVVGGASRRRGRLVGGNRFQTCRARLRGHFLLFGQGQSSGTPDETCQGQSCRNARRECHKRDYGLGIPQSAIRNPEFSSAPCGPRPAGCSAFGYSRGGGLGHVVVLSTRAQNRAIYSVPDG